MKTKPIKKDPDELWSSYFFSRLESEGLLKTRDNLKFNSSGDKDGLCSYVHIELNCKNYDSLSIELCYMPAFDLKYPPAKFSNIKFILSETISADGIAFRFKGNIAEIATDIMDFPNVQVRNEPFINVYCYRNACGRQCLKTETKYPPEGVIDDVVQYVKSVGIKEK